MENNLRTLIAGTAAFLLLTGFSWPWESGPDEGDTTLVEFAKALQEQNRSPDSLGYAMKKFVSTPEKTAKKQARIRKTSPRVKAVQTAIRKKDPNGLNELKTQLGSLGAKDADEGVVLMELASNLATPPDELAQFALSEVIANSDRAQPFRAYSSDAYLQSALATFLGASHDSKIALEGARKAIDAQSTEAQKELLLETVDLHSSEISEELRASVGMNGRDGGSFAGF